MLFVIPFSRSLLHSRQPRAESHTEREGGRERERERNKPTTGPPARSERAQLTVPDWAWAMRSRPRMVGLMALCWMAEGFSKP